MPTQPARGLTYDVWLTLQIPSSHRVVVAATLTRIGGSSWRSAGSESYPLPLHSADLARLSADVITVIRKLVDANLGVALELGDELPAANANSAPTPRVSTD